jgi:ABC-type glycerol-3-phosphate transport system permease component
VYFGNIGENSKTITEYFETNGAKPCAATANPAEYILDVIGAGATARVEEDWHAIWNTSPEYHKLIEEIRKLRGQGANQVLPLDVDTQDQADADHSSNQASNKSAPTKFAASWIIQYKMVQIRMFQHYWRSPVYIVGKAILNVFAGLFLGFTFYMESNSIAGLQNKLFAVFMSILLCFPLMAQLQPTFVSLRKIYEVREKPSKMYHW